MTLTNAQVALQAAATVYSGGRGHSSPDHVTGMASQFKRWLDKQDNADEPQVKPVGVFVELPERDLTPMPGEYRMPPRPAPSRARPRY